MIGDEMRIVLRNSFRLLTGQIWCRCRPGGWRACRMLLQLGPLRCFCLTNSLDMFNMSSGMKRAHNIWSNYSFRPQHDVHHPAVFHCWRRDFPDGGKRSNYSDFTNRPGPPKVSWERDIFLISGKSRSVYWWNVIIWPEHLCSYCLVKMKAKQPNYLLFWGEIFVDSWNSARYLLQLVPNMMSYYVICSTHLHLIHRGGDPVIHVEPRCC